jgi:hypothetical protein
MDWPSVKEDIDAAGFLDTDPLPIRRASTLDSLPRASPEPSFGPEVATEVGKRIAIEQ